MAVALKLTVNLGHADAARYGVAEVEEGSLVSVAEAHAGELIERGWAALAADPSAQPKRIKAVPDRKVKGVPEN